MLEVKVVVCILDKMLLVVAKLAMEAERRVDSLQAE